MVFFLNFLLGKNILVSDIVQWMLTLKLTYFCNQCKFSITGTSPFPVVHQASNIVRELKFVYLAVSHLLKIFCTIFGYVLLIDCDVIISIIPRMFMVEPQNMQKFVLYCSFCLTIWELKIKQKIKLN